MCSADLEEVVILPPANGIPHVERERRRGTSMEAAFRVGSWQRSPEALMGPRCGCGALYPSDALREAQVAVRSAPLFTRDEATMVLDGRAVREDPAVGNRAPAIPFPHALAVGTGYYDPPAG